MYTVKKLPERQKDKNGCCPSININGKYINPVSNWYSFNNHILIIN